MENNKSAQEDPSAIVRPGYAPQPEPEKDYTAEPKNENTSEGQESQKVENKKRKPSPHGPMGENNHDAVSGIDYSVPSSSQE